MCDHTAKDVCIVALYCTRARIECEILHDKLSIRASPFVQTINW